MPSPTTPGTSCPQTWDLTFHPHYQPHNNNDDREMRTNCNPSPKNPVTNAGIDKAASCWSVLLPHSGARWGKTWEVGKGKLGRRKKKKEELFSPVNCSKGGTPPRTPGAELSLAHTAPAPQSQRSLGGIRPCLQASQQGSAADWRPPACRTQPWAR